MIIVLQIMSLLSHGIIIYTDDFIGILVSDTKLLVIDSDSYQCGRLLKTVLRGKNDLFVVFKNGYGEWWIQSTWDNRIKAKEFDAWADYDYDYEYDEFYDEFYYNRTQDYIY
jgi:hypothetical protein